MPLPGAHGSDLFVADYRNHRLCVFALDHAGSGRCPFARQIGGGDSATRGRFSGPSGVCVANEVLCVAEIGNERVQLLTLAGLPLQVLPACGPCSGVAADDEHVCATSVEGDHAITLWRTRTAASTVMMSDRLSMTPPA